jgi:hypothetical protein
MNDALGVMPRTMTPLAGMAQHFGIPLSKKTIQPFLDLEQDRNRANLARMFAAPVGGAFTHLAPVVPASVHGVAGAGTLPISSAIPQMMGMANPAAEAGAGILGGLGGTVMGHLAPMLAMGALGAGGAVLGTYGVGKLVNSLIKRRQRKRLAKQQAESGILGLPKFGAILDSDEEQGAEMFSDVRFVKFAAEGALGYSVPESFEQAVEKVAFTAGFFTQVMAKHAVNGDEAKVLEDLVAATKMAKDLTNRLRNRLRVKTASEGYDHSAEAIIKECFSGLKKTAAAPNAKKGLSGVVFDRSSKTASALALFGLDETTLRGLSGGKQVSGTGLGLIGLVA